MNKPPPANETMGQEQTPPALEGPRAIARRRSIRRVWIQWNFITALHSARAVTQVHGECIGRTVNRGLPPSRSAILDFCFICLRQSGCSSLSSPIISWARAFLSPTLYLSPKRMARVSKRITDRCPWRVLLNVSLNRVAKCTIYRLVTTHCGGDRFNRMTDETWRSIAAILLWEHFSRLFLFNEESITKSNYSKKMA